MRGAPPSLTLESCFADSRQDYIVKLIEDAEAAQLRYQSPKQFRPDRNEQRHHPDCQSHLYARSQFPMTNAIISPTANPIIMPAATPRQSTFCSLVVISTSQSHGKP